MSVLVSKRNVSLSEHAMYFQNLYCFTEKEIKKISKRQYAWLGEPILTEMNDIYKLIMMTVDDYFVTDKTPKEYATLIISKFRRLQKRLIALWNICDYTTNKMIQWAELLNNEIYYVSLYGELGWSKGKYMYILDFEAIKKMEFLRVMSILHKTIYTKAISLPPDIRGSKGTLLMDLADEAFYAINEANRIFPENKEQYEKRTKYISITMNKIKQMQVPLFSVFTNIHYSERIMYEITGLVNQEFRLLQGLLKSDKQRFGKL